MGKKRIIWADSLKGWLMLLVILGHAIQSVMGAGCDKDHVLNLICSFHMPAFVAVSGWFAYRCNRNRGGYVSACKRRSYQLLTPYLIWSLVQWSLGGCDIGNIPNLILQPDCFFWFLWVLFWICCIFIFCQWIADKLKIDELIPVGISCLLLMGVMVGLEFRYFGFQFLAYYFIFYTMGYCVHRFSLLQIKNNIILLVLTVVWAFMAWFWNMHELPSWMPAIPHIPSSLLQYAYRGLTAAIAMLIIFGVAPKALNGASKFNCWIKELGVVSLGLYVCHLTIIGYINNLMNNILPNCSIWGQIGIDFILAAILSIIIVELLAKNKWTARFFLGKV